VVPRRRSSQALSLRRLSPVVTNFMNRTFSISRWNVRGLGDCVKCGDDLVELLSANPTIALLQEQSLLIFPKLSFAPSSLFALTPLVMFPRMAPRVTSLLLGPPILSLALAPTPHLTPSLFIFSRPSLMPPCS
jgi:hypothetical protein